MAVEGKACEPNSLCLSKGFDKGVLAWKACFRMKSLEGVAGGMEREGVTGGRETSLDDALMT